MSALRLVNRTQSDSADVVGAFESATAEVVGQYHPLAQRSVLYALAAMLLLLVAFISFAHLDRIVTTTGRLVPVKGALTVQPLNKAIVKDVLVSVGDIVRKGQVLATLDPTFVQADLIELQQKIASLDPQKRRMEAEEAGQPFRPINSYPYEVLQDSIWKQRQTEFQSGVTDFDQRINSSEALAAGLRQSIADYKARLKIALETEHMYIEMAKAEIASRLQLITVQDTKLELARKLAEAENNLASSEHTVASLKEQREVYINKWHDDNTNNLVLAKNQLEQAQGDLTKAMKMKELVDLVAPVDAVVLKIPILATGGVATDAEPMFSLMPVGAALEVDAQIDSKDSGFVRIGDPVRIKFDAYKFLEHGTGDGVVKTITQDSFTEVSSQDAITKTTDNQTRSPYFDTRITITAVKLHDVPADFHLVPGMTLQADIVVGRRTILWYLLGGALRSGAEAMREP